jgi:Putative zinc-finger
MNCQWVKDNAFLYAYDELPDDQRFEFEQHVTRCSGCGEEVKALRGLREAMSVVPVLEPSASLLASSRMLLQEALEITEQDRGWKRWFYDPFSMIGHLKFSPALAAVLLMFGFVGGAGVTYKLAHSGSSNNGGGIIGTGSNSVAQGQDAQMSIAGIREIQEDPSTKKVFIKYDTLQPQTAEGSINDQRIQQLLMYAARNNTNSGIRLNSIDALTKQPEDSKIREALIASLRFDNNPGVRLKTLEALGPYVKDDVVVRNAILEALLHDANPGVRSLALQTLQPVKADSTVRMALQFLSEKDKDQAIRRQTRAMLASMPQID